jgi:membrane-bound lytic murein transglycosylase B
MQRLYTLMLLCVVSLNVSCAADFAHKKSVQSFIQEMHQKHGFDPKTLTQWFKAFGPEPKILALMSKQYEALPWYRYQNTIVTEKRIQEGVAFWQEHADTLEKAEQQFGVPAEIIVALLGLESSYGKIMGKYPVLQSLSTLAFEYPRRAKFFRAELEHFLLLTKEGALDPLLTQGSYAGAMGMPQFMPSSYRQYAVDFSGKGKRDLIFDTKDVIGSVGNYLHQHGWKKNAKIIRKGKWPSPKSPSSLKTVPIVLKISDQREEHWTGQHNFYVITRYNHSVHYAMAVYELSNKIRTLRNKSKGRKYNAS